MEIWHGVYIAGIGFLFRRVFKGANLLQIDSATLALGVVSVRRDFVGPKRELSPNRPHYLLVLRFCRRTVLRHL